jgi:hypothetical protein
MAEMSGLPPSTDAYSSASEIPTEAKVIYAIVASIGFFGLVGCLGE